MNVSTRRLWFHIEAAFADIHRLCADARATELKAKEAAAQAEDPDMPMWREPRFEVSGDIEATVSIAAPVPERRGDGHQGADVVALRAELRKRLVQLRLKLAENLTEREAYYALFPVVIYVDELVQSVFEGKARLYRPLQQELFEIDNGGEAFYSVADTLLRKAETLPLIFEVFYFCLSDGFRGMYVQEPARIEEYQAPRGAARGHRQHGPGGGPAGDLPEALLPGRRRRGAGGLRGALRLGALPDRRTRRRRGGGRPGSVG